MGTLNRSLCGGLIRPSLCDDGFVTTSVSLKQGQVVKLGNFDAYSPLLCALSELVSIFYSVMNKPLGKRFC